MNTLSRRRMLALASPFALALAMCLAMAPGAVAQRAPAQPQAVPAEPSAQPQLMNGPYLTEGHRYMNPTLERYADQTAAEVQESISTLPDYSAFDNIEFTVNPALDQVTLYGQVTNPELARAAEAIVKSVPGITGVTNRIAILPASQRDARLRESAYRAIYGNPQLARYRGNDNPPIHIVVENGKVTLIGVVADEHDRTVAYQRTSRLPGVSAAKNELMVDPYAASDYPG